MEPSIAPRPCACRPAGRKETKYNQAAEKATHQEWGRLRSRKGWGEDNPREWYDVASEARATKQELHCGLIVGLVVDKNTDPL